MARFVQIARERRLDYDGFLYVCQQARRKPGLRKPRQERLRARPAAEGVIDNRRTMNDAGKPWGGGLVLSRPMDNAMVFVERFLPRSWLARLTAGLFRV